MRTCGFAHALRLRCSVLFANTHQRCLENLIELGAGDWPFSVLPDIAPGPDRIQGSGFVAGLISNRSGKSMVP
jgi:hypothetical protein